ncbi:hypothetical protein OAT68_02525 [Flavobacteriaceae bacterium]|nr:hypothetical protein [Flavobacteriaceae bacterium]
MTGPNVATEKVKTDLKLKIKILPEKSMLPNMINVEKIFFSRSVKKSKLENNKRAKP